MKCANRVSTPAAAAARISEELWAFGRSSVLSAALELGVFEPLALRPLGAAAVASATQCSPKGIRILLDSLVAMQLLARSVRTGRPVQRVDTAQRAKNFFPELVRALFPVNFPVSQAAARKMGVGRTRRGLRILDVAAGSAAWSMGFALADEEAQVTALDFPPVLRVARSYARRFGCLGRYRFLPGDLEKADFGENAYDLILLGHICHSVGSMPAAGCLPNASAHCSAGGSS